MCYFTKKVLNKRFLPNRKNRWNPPVCTDERFRYVEVNVDTALNAGGKKEENGESETTNNSKKHLMQCSLQEQYRHKDMNTYANNTGIKTTEVKTTR